MSRLFSEEILGGKVSVEAYSVAHAGTGQAFRDLNFTPGPQLY